MLSDCPAKTIRASINAEVAPLSRLTAIGLSSDIRREESSIVLRFDMPVTRSSSPSTISLLLAEHLGKVIALSKMCPLRSG